MRKIDYAGFLEGVTKAFISEPDFYEYFIRKGFDPTDWPQCAAKEIAVAFHQTAQNKSIEHARLYFAGKAEGLKDPKFLENPETLITAFYEAKLFGLGLDLGRSIMNEPWRANELIKGFKNNNGTGVVTKRLKEHITDHMMGMLKKENQASKVCKLSGWPVLSENIGGFNPGRTMLIVAGTGVGKTTLAINLMLSAIIDKACLFVNMEMGFEDIFDRFSLAQAGVSNYQIRLGGEAVTSKMSTAANYITRHEDILITDGRILSIEQICSEIYKHKEEHNIKIIIVDYDQKIRTKFAGEEWQTVQRAVEDLEEVAKATETCIIILAQGDDNNLPKASKRSMQSASTVLSFYKEDKKYIIEAKKNRFGPKGFRLEVSCNFETFQISEVGACRDLPRNDIKDFR